MLEEIKIQNQIYEIRGKQVMLDADLAKLYQCKNGTKSINLAVKRHIDRFPERFMFRLTKEEYIELLRFQTETFNIKQDNYSKYLPYAFTEQGVAMLATILKTEVAAKTSIAIMDAFVEMKKYISNSLIENNYYKNMIINHEHEIKLLKETLYKFEQKENTTGLFFKGQIYDAYSLLRDILNTAENNVIIIDNYIDRNLLNLLKEITLPITIITNKYNNSDYTKYKEQYKNISLKVDNKFHDRFIIIDERILYHSGASFKDLGKKCFAINKITNDKWLEDLLKNIKN